jgi:hypothetical protein
VTTASQGRKFVYHRPWLYPKQERAIFDPSDATGAPARYSFIEASTKTGKTVGSIAWLFERAYLGEPNQNRWWVAPVSGQAMIAFRRMKAGIPQRLIESVREGSRITLLGNRTIWFKSGDNPDLLFGEDVHDAVMDEASRTKEEAFHAVRSTLTATRGGFRGIGNVKGRRNWFYHLCRRAEMGETNMSYHKIIAADAVAAGVLAADEVEDARRVLPESVFRELYLAEPSDDSGNPFDLKAIRHCVIPLSGGRPQVWGWDLAKSVDWTVGIALDDAGRVCRLERFQLPWDATINRIAAATGGTPALVDSTGVGDPVLEMLQKRCSRAEGYLFSAPAKQQLMEGLALAIQSGTVSYPDGPIVLELEQFEYEYTRTGVRYSAPEGFHDDCVCALALAVQHRAHAQGPLIISDSVLAWSRVPARGIRAARFR